MGLLLQALLAVFILKTSLGKAIFKTIGDAVTKVIDFSQEGAAFVFGPLINVPAVSKAFGGAGGFIFFFKIIPTILFVAVLVNIGYYFGIIQRVVQVLAKGLFWLMKVSGAEALSNISSAFVGQVEAQIMIQPYLKGMTKSELLASMSGSFACISGGVMAAYIGLGVPAEYLLAASIMAAPGALAIAKIVYPETEQSETAGDVRIAVHKTSSNLVDAISVGCSDGLRIGLNVAAMLIGFLALIALVNYGLNGLGALWGDPKFSLDSILGFLFSGFAWCMGVQGDEIFHAGSLMGQKLVANEFVAYNSLSAYLPSSDPNVVKEVALINGHPMSPKTIAIVSFALCGFANFGSMGIQIGGISALEPTRRQDLTKLVLRALITGTLASYLSATLAGMLL
ncbi:MAG TPA: nucleoside transporter C-terminal domain-containing protein, partial [Saprospiraceae bacterium]|nr:nucleoside transporter C-terminal domain-containing protein [Saprospiraceae bacterium]